MTGVRWQPCAWKVEGEDKVVYTFPETSQGRGRRQRTRAGVLNGDGVSVVEGGQRVGEYRKPGLFPEVATYLYRQVADVWGMDNEFAAHWGSWAWPREHRDLKVVLAAFLLVQNRAGEPVVENGKLLFHDDDYRAVGEAMCLLRGLGDGKRSINPKLLLRVGNLLRLDGVAEINRSLGFGRSARRPPTGRYASVVEKWLRYREHNPRTLEGLVKAGYRSTVQRLARRVGYKPETPAFFQTLRWRQKQAPDGRRVVGIGMEVEAAESWEGLTEAEVCERIESGKPDWKRIVGLLPTTVGVTRAVMAAALEAGSLSDRDIVIATPTLEDLGLLEVAPIKARWETAMRAAEDQRAAHIAKRVRKVEVKEALEDAADAAMAAAVEEVVRDMRIYVVVDKSASMEIALDEARVYLQRMLVAFPLERLHVSVFNTVGREVELKASSARAVEQAFRGHRASGGTVHAEGVRVLARHRVQEGEDALMIFVGDQGESGGEVRLARAVEASGIEPVALGMVHVVSPRYGSGTAVMDAAARLGIPYVPLDLEMFSDAYAAPRVLREVIAATPVTRRVERVRPARKTLVQEILETPLLERPLWA